MILGIGDVDVRNQRVVTRVDMNVPQDANGEIMDDTRIRESLPTIRSIVERGGIPILMSHLGRPKGVRSEKYSLRPVANRLAELLPDYTVQFATDCIGPAAQEAATSATTGSVVLLENLRFYAEEESNDQAFCDALASNGTMYCNDAFGTAHRAHASTAGVASRFSVVCAGLLMERELAYLGKALQNPVRPYVSILGGAKVSGKIDVLMALLNTCNTILVGGGMMFTFLKAQGKNVGSSLVEEEKLQLAADIIAMATEKHVQLLLPTDTVVADAFSNDAPHQTCSVDAIPNGWMGLDIGPNTAAAYAAIIEQAGTVVWNGPMGVFEFSNFSAGTRVVAGAMATATRNGCVTIVGGGDSAAAITQFGYATHVSHVSTGGGASLEFMEGKTLPGVVALDR